MDTIITSIAFYIISFLIIIGALGVVFNKAIVNSALMLFLSFISIAALYILLNSDFLAVSQILIYSVGIAILMLFAVMLTNPKAEQTTLYKRPRLILSTIVAFYVFLLLVKVVLENKFSLSTISSTVSEVILKEGTSGIIGKELLSTYVLPFEMVSILLLAAIIGAVVLARRNPDKYDTE